MSEVLFKIADQVRKRLVEDKQKISASELEKQADLYTPKDL